MTLKSLKTLMTLMPTPAGVKFNTSGVGGLGRAPFRARKRTRSLTKSEALRACKSDAPAERVLLRFLVIFRILRFFRQWRLPVPPLNREATLCVRSPAHSPCLPMIPIPCR